MILPIVQTGDPVLRQAAQSVDPAWIGTKEFRSLVADMVETMRAAPGVGLAAPQVGQSLQIVVLEDPEDAIDEMDDDYVDERDRQGVQLTVLVNPTIEPIGDEMVSFHEGCLSVSGFAGLTPRHKRVRVRALDESGTAIELDWHGWPARILQHELDHLAGRLYIDRMDPRTFATVENLQRYGVDED